METVLLVSEQRMKQWTNLDNNIRIDVLTPSILQAQDLYIQNTLGTPFYKRLKEGVINNDLTTDEADFLKDYVGPTLIQYALYILMPSLKYKMVEKGILNGTSEETSPTTLDELQYLRNATLDTAEFYNTRMLEFLRQNPGMFALYTNPTPMDGMRPDKTTPYFSGLQTKVPYNRNGKNKNLWIYADCGTNCDPDCSNCY